MYGGSGSRRRAAATAPGIRAHGTAAHRTRRRGPVLRLRHQHRARCGCRPGRLAGTDLCTRLLAAEQALDQDFHAATAGLLPEQARRDHRVSLNTSRSPGCSSDGRSRTCRSVKAAGPAAPAAGGWRNVRPGSLRDQLGRQVVVEIGLLQGSGRQQVDNGAHCTCSVREPACFTANVAQNAAMQQVSAGYRAKTSASIELEVRCTSLPQARVMTRVLL